MAVSRTLFASNSDEWNTPQEIFDELDKEFHFDLDPCCTHENAKCLLHYTKAEDGLTQSWGGIRCSVIRHTARLANG